MEKSEEKMKFNPIGYVKSPVKKPRYGNWKNVVSKIILKKGFSKALDGLDDYSHIVVVYWMDKVRGYVLRHSPQGREDVPVVGIFACRCPARPNPIGISAVKLVGVRGNVIKVRGLDVLDKTPVLDIKPYSPHYDLIRNPKVPAWVYKLDY